MSKWFFLLLILFTASWGFAQSNALQDLKVDVVYLSSDYLEGRETGSKGEALAAEYIAHRFKAIGLKPMGENDTWFHDFDFVFKSNPHAAEGEPRTGMNVVGYIDNGAPTTVVIGAHYDHLGHGHFGSLHAGEKAIHNGADDNASGIAAMLRIAAALNKTGKAKGNNYLFIGFSGEELGLYGSKNFVNTPTIDKGAINYMINMDMVGRLNEEKVLAVNGAGTSPVWKPALEKIKVGGIQAKTSDSGVGPSDHTSFYLENIPVLHFFTGQHMDYHKPSDDAHLVNYQGLLDVSDYIIALIENLDGQGKIAFTKTKDEDESRKATSFKVTLGVMPDYVYNGEGMRVDGVLDGRPAAAAGLEKGDIIIKLGDIEVKDIYSYMEGLGKFKKGETTKVVFKRGEKMMEKEVTF